MKKHRCKCGALMDVVEEKKFGNVLKGTLTKKERFICHNCNKKHKWITKKLRVDKKWISVLKVRIIGWNCSNQCVNKKRYGARTKFKYCPLCGTRLTKIKEYKLPNVKKVVGDIL